MSVPVVAKKQLEDVKDLMAQNAPQFQAMLRNIMPPEKFLAICSTLYQDSPELQKCSVQSFVRALIFLAQVGLPPGAMRQAYLIPYGSICTPIVSYMGLLTLARRSGYIKRVNASVVYDGDSFSWSMEPPDVRHGAISSWWNKPPKEADEHITGAYAVALLTNGEKHVEFMQSDRLRWHRDRYSKAAKQGPWVTEFAAMSCKTVLRKLCKLLPVEGEQGMVLQKVVAVDEQIEAGIQPSFDLVSFGGSVPQGQPEPVSAKPAETDKTVHESTPTPVQGPKLAFAPKERKHCTDKAITEEAVTPADLTWYEDFYQKALKNPARTSYRKQDEEMLTAIKNELIRRGERPASML